MPSGTYVGEPGTAQVLEWCGRADELLLSVIAVPEMISAFWRLRREAWLTQAESTQIKQDLMTDLADAQLCATTPAVLQFAIQALESSALRGVDAIHIGAVKLCEADVFVSADTRQCAVARSAGLKVVTLQAQLAFAGHAIVAADAREGTGARKRRGWSAAQDPQGPCDTRLQVPMLSGPTVTICVSSDLRRSMAFGLVTLCVSFAAGYHGSSRWERWHGVCN